MERMKELLSMTQAAERKGVSRAALYQAIKKGKLKAVQIGGHTFLRPADLDAYTPVLERKGVSIGGRPRTKPVEEKPKRGRGRPPKVQVQP